MLLFNYYKSTCSWRVRTVLNLKNIEYTKVDVMLLENDQLSEEYKKYNPSGHVPALCIDGEVLTESMSICLYVEERFPEKRRLIPENLLTKAKVIRICEMVNSGI